MLIHSDPNNMNSIVYHLIIERYSMQNLTLIFSLGDPFAFIQYDRQRWKATAAALLSPIFWLLGHIPNQKSLWELFTQNGTDNQNLGVWLKVPKRVRTTWLASRHSHAFLIHLSELFTTRNSGRPIRFPRIVTPTGREKTVHAVRCPCTSRKCRFSRQMKGISVVSDIWSQSFYSTEASFQFNSKIYRRHVYRGMSPRKFRSKPEVDFQSHETEKLPRYWNSRSQPNDSRCSPSLLNENWCLCDLSHGITLRTASYRFT